MTTERRRPGSHAPERRVNPEDVDAMVRLLNEIRELNPAELARNISDLQQWRVRMDGEHTRGGPGRLHDLEDDRTEMRGALKFFRLVATIVTFALGVIALAAVLGWKPA